jgi:hypothetical protein
MFLSVLDFEKIIMKKEIQYQCSQERVIFLKVMDFWGK